MTISRPKVLTAFMLEYLDNAEQRGVSVDEKNDLRAVKEVTVSVNDVKPVPQADLSKYLDCSNESIRRIMAEFEDEGIIEKVEHGGYSGSTTWRLAENPAGAIMRLYD